MWHYSNYFVKRYFNKYLSYSYKTKSVFCTYSSIMHDSAYHYLVKINLYLYACNNTLIKILIE